MLMRWPPIWWRGWRSASGRPGAGSPFSFWQSGSWCAWWGCRSAWPHNCSWGTGRWVVRWWSDTRISDVGWDSCGSCRTCRTDRRRADTRLVRNLKNVKCVCAQRGTEIVIVGGKRGRHTDGWVVSEWVKVSRNEILQWFFFVYSWSCMSDFIYYIYLRFHIFFSYSISLNKSNLQKLQKNIIKNIINKKYTYFINI